METLKKAVVASPAIRPIDYSTSNEVILAVDSSYIAVGWILSQVDEQGRRRPSRFGSITWNDRESRYSQAKLELYGLFRALKATKVWTIGIKNFTVEVDAKYIKGMLSNPDIQPNAAVNRWIAGILMFDFKLKHVAGIKHLAPDGLSCRRHAPEDSDDEEASEDVEEWIDEILGCTIWLAHSLDSVIAAPQQLAVQLVLTSGSPPITTTPDTSIIPLDPRTRQRD